MPPEPDRPRRTTEPVKPAKPAEPVKPAKPAKPAKPNKPAKPADGSRQNLVAVITMLAMAIGLVAYMASTGDTTSTGGVPVNGDPQVEVSGSGTTGYEHDETSDQEEQGAARDEAPSPEGASGKEPAAPADNTPKPKTESEQSTQPKPSEQPQEDAHDVTERAARHENPLFVNDAPTFMYRETLTDDERSIYDAMVSLLSYDPTDVENYVRVQLSGIDEGALRDAFRLAYYAVIFDHPEFFWISADDTATISYYYYGASEGIQSINIRLDKPYSACKEQMDEFNGAVRQFMSDIDLSQSDADIALAIHDKLIAMATYDEPLRQAKRSGLGHTAFGALVRNDEGEPNHAVCDGYSLAYEYLLQQAGIEAGVVQGLAGPSVDSPRSESHVWSIVRYDGRWHEADATWDDKDEDSVEEAHLRDNPDDYECATHLRASMADPDYAWRAQHMFYDLATATMRDFVPGDEYTYYHDDGWYTYVEGPSIHLRAFELESEFDGTEIELSRRAPTAD